MKNLSNLTDSPPRYADIETASDDYARRFAGATGAWLLRRQTELVLAAVRHWQLLNPGRLPKILDIGGGHAQVALPLLAENLDITVAVSGTPYQKSLDHSVATGRCKINVVDLLHLPWQAGEFDIITSVRLLPHFSEWQKLIAEMSRVAGSMVVVDYPTPSSFSALTPWLFSAKKIMEGNTRTYEMFRHQQIAAAFGASGFKTLTRTGEFFWPMVVHRMLKSPGLSGILEAGPRVIGLTARLGSPVIAVMERVGKGS